MGAASDSVRRMVVLQLGQLIVGPAIAMLFFDWQKILFRMGQKNSQGFWQAVRILRQA
jgi:hypothetical protein